MSWLINQSRLAADQALYLVLRALDVANKYVTDAAPWKLPAGDPKRRVVVRTLLEVPETTRDCPRLPGD